MSFFRRLPLLAWVLIAIVASIARLSLSWVAVRASFWV